MASGTTNDVPAFICSERIEKILDSISLQLPANKRLDSLFKAIVLENSFDEFIEDINRNKVESFISVNGSYSTYIPVCFDGNNHFMRLKFVPDDWKHGNYVLTLKTMD